MVYEYSAYVRGLLPEFSHAPPERISPSPDDKKQWSLVWFGLLQISLCILMISRRLFKLHHVQNLLKMGCWVWGDGWDKDKVDVMVVHMTRQVMLVVVEIIKLKQKLEEHSAGGSKVHSDMQEFGDCVNDIEVEDINSTCLFYTWIKSPFKPETSILKKLDRVMVNSDFIDHYGNANARFLPFLISDHSPVVLHIPNTLEKKKKSFRFSNFVADKEEFIDVLAWKKGNLFQYVKKLEDELKKAQVEVEANPNCKVIKEKLSNVLQEYNQAIIDEEKLLAQKAKVKWLSEGDRNTKLITLDAIFGIRNAKAPGPYGYTSMVFKQSWDIVGGDVCGAVKEFFKSNKLLGEVNAIKYRGSKIITKRIQWCLEKMVNMNQSAFVPGRLIQDNLLITQELLKGYNRKNGPKRCALKIDIAKSYDTVNWDFLKQILIHFGFHEKIIGWIMTCVTSAAFTVCVNGERYGYFKSGRGLRQGDPMSPYLFTLVMEILTLIIQRRVLKEGPMEFSKVSGLVPNMNKSTIFFGNVKESEKQRILEVMPFSVENLPMKYLGVPLITKNIGVSE
ncbi:RNA-directed DNA polymerase, eukaryota, reverse transcriptase zinc-binding domain protein [Tanacetum coccineum]